MKLGAVANCEIFPYDATTVMHDVMSYFHLFLQYLIQFKILFTHFSGQQVSLLHFLYTLESGIIGGVGIIGRGEGGGGVVGHCNNY